VAVLLFTKPQPEYQLVHGFVKFVVAWRVSVSFSVHFAGDVESGSEANQVSNTTRTEHVLLDDFLLFTFILFKRYKATKFYHIASQSQFLYDAFTFANS
jgi:hypothetical protein